MNITAIEQKARALTEDIRNSDAFVEFAEVHEKVKKTKPHYREVNEIRRVYFKALSQDTEAGVRSAIEAMQKKYAESLAKGYVKEFLEKEQRCCMMVQQVYDILDENIRFDMAFMYETEEDA